MISFQQLCESSTLLGTYSWFYFYRSLLPSLTDEEKSTVHIEDINDRTFVRVWWPKEKWISRPDAKHDMKQQMIDAVNRGDFAEALRIKMEMSKV